MADKKERVKGIYVVLGTSFNERDIRDKEREDRQRRKLEIKKEDEWAPSTFVSSRNNKASKANFVQQRPSDFMDERDRRELAITTNEEYRGTQRKVDQMDESSSSLNQMIEGTLQNQLVVPKTDPIGFKLLKLMGWREGQGIGAKKKRELRKDENEDALELDEEDENEGPSEYFFAPVDVSSFEFKQKSDQYGIGYDPLVHAPEFASRFCLFLSFFPSNINLNFINISIKM